MSKELKETREIITDAYYRNADRISQLQTENKALREALGRLSEWSGEVGKIAEQALKQK